MRWSSLRLGAGEDTRLPSLSLGSVEAPPPAPRRRVRPEDMLDVCLGCGGCGVLCCEVGRPPGRGGLWRWMLVLRSGLLGEARKLGGALQVLGSDVYSAVAMLLPDPIQVLRRIGMVQAVVKWSRMHNIKATEGRLLSGPTPAAQPHRITSTKQARRIQNHVKMNQCFARSNN